MNLIENASEYAETKGSSGGKVEVKAHTREGYDVSAYVRSKSGKGVSLKQSISRYSSVDLEDVYNVKKALKGAGYAAGNGIVKLAGKENAKKLGLNMQAFEESAGDAFKRGYASARDEHRNLLTEGQKKMPVAIWNKIYKHEDMYSFLSTLPILFIALILIWQHWDIYGIVIKDFLG